MGRRKQISKTLRFEVFKRDSFTCQYCGADAPEAVLHVDHITPVASGGDNDLTNLITSCVKCNLGKGATELSDRSAVSRQKAQLDELNARREQLEMMAEWRSGLRSIEAKEADIAVEEMHDHIHPYTLNETGKKIIARVIKRYGLKMVIAGIQKSCEINLKFGPDGNPYQDSVTRAIDNLGRAIRLAGDPPHMHQARYINGIARNRVSLTREDQKNLTSRLISIHEAGGDLDSVKSDVLGVDDIEGLIAILESHEGRG